MSGVHGELIQLPNEILTIIINKLASDAGDDERILAALASCRLASHVLHSLTTPILFSSIQLIEAPWANPNVRPAAFKERATKLKQILTTSDIASSVHTLALLCRKANLEDSVNSTLISAIIYRLPHIRTFVLKSGRGRLEFTAIAGDFAAAIKALCKSPNLTTLDLCNITEFPFTVVAACPNLQYLRLSWVSLRFDDINPIDETSSLQSHKLDSLEIDEGSLCSLCLSLGDSGLNDNISFASFAKICSQIKNLQLKNFFFNEATLQCGWDIMLLASKSLTTLDFPLVDKSYTTAFLAVSRYNLGRFPALRHFKIQIRIWFGHNALMLDRLNQLFSITSSTSGIETLEIMITWAHVQTGAEMDLFSSDVGWSTLYDVLSSEKFVSLKKVALGLGLEMLESDRKAYYHNQTNLELGTPPYVNTLFSMFSALTKP